MTFENHKNTFFHSFFVIFRFINGLEIISDKMRLFNSIIIILEYIKVTSIFVLFMSLIIITKDQCFLRKLHEILFFYITYYSNLSMEFLHYGQIYMLFSFHKKHNLNILLQCMFYKNSDWKKQII